MKLNDVAYPFFYVVIVVEVKRRLLRLPKGAACPAAELMRRDECFAGQPLCEPFEERARRLHAVGEGSLAIPGGDVSLQTT
jgi:hypothetical protein